MGWAWVERPKVKNAEGFWVTPKEETVSFKPTHEFRGLELRQGSEGDAFNTWYEDAEGYGYRLPNSRVRKIQPKPQPGEVWKYVGAGAPRTSLELVDDGGLHFIDVDGDRTLAATSLSDYVKILNADGSPA